MKDSKIFIIQVRIIIQKSYLIRKIGLKYFFRASNTLLSLIQNLFLYLKMNAFKKKPTASQSSEPASLIQQMNKKMNLLLGLGSSQLISSTDRKTGQLNRDLILACAMFWDSKKRIDKIKSLILKQQELQQFNDTEDFQVSELMSIELLSLSKNKITYLQPLAILDTLICLNINYNKVYDISPLSQLLKLEQLYASNNQISHIDSLKSLKKLRILNLYSNKINRVDETICTLKSLSDLEQLDIQQNQVYTLDSRNKFLALQKLARFNGELIYEEEREKLGIASESMVVMPTAKFRDTHTSFFGSNKSQARTSITKASEGQSSKFRSKVELQQMIGELEKKYIQVDDKFQDEIVKNVRLKSEFQKIIQKKRVLSRKNEDIKDKQQQIVLLKRKVKMLKQNLFNNPQSQAKGELLRELFQLQMMDDSIVKKKQSQANQTNKSARQNLWVRKFDFDEEIYLSQCKDDKYFMDQDEELDMLLNQNNSALQQLKKELREMNQ